MKKLKKNIINKIGKNFCKVIERNNLLLVFAKSGMEDRKDYYDRKYLINKYGNVLMFKNCGEKMEIKHPIYKTFPNYCLFF